MASEGLVTAKGPPALEVRGLTRKYGSRVAVDSLDLCVQVGDVYGFLGPNGAGKTTAIRCILGLIAKNEGDVTILGDRHPVRQRAAVGAVVETPAFHGWMTARDNLRRSVAFGGLGTASDIDWALNLVGLAGREQERVRTYSLGMRQRLGIARALVTRPKLLLLDEPTNGLDPRGMKEVRDLLAELARRERITIFISSHLLSEIEQLCNRVGIIEKGRLVAEGSVSELVQGRGSVEEVVLGGPNCAALQEALTVISGVTVVGLEDGSDGAQRVRVHLEGLSVEALNRSLVESGVGVSALVPVQRSLEDLFLQLTSEDIT